MCLASFNQTNLSIDIRIASSFGLLQSCYEYLWKNLYVHIYFYFTWVNTYEWNFSVIIFIRNCQTIFQNHLYHFTIPSAVYESFTYSIFLPHLIKHFLISALLVFSEYVVVSHCVFFVVFFKFYLLIYFWLCWVFASV